jgi:glutaredoxin
MEIFEKSGNMGVPQIELNGKIIVGFDKEALEKELENA